MKYFYGNTPIHPNVRNRANVALLPPNVLNSVFPAWEEQLLNDKVLHLAGAHDVLRYAIFKKAC